MICLLCGSERREPLTFRTLLSPENPPGFCRSCRDRLLPIPGGHSCRFCGRDLRLVPEGMPSKDQVCADCLLWQSSEESRAFGKNTALFSYNNQMKDIMKRFKFRGDAVLVEGFRQEFRAAYHRISGRRRFFSLKRAPDPPVIVPMPLSPERLKERGYNQAELLARLLPGTPVPALRRPGGQQKQSKLHRHDRLNRENPFKLDQSLAAKLTGRSVLLIDDIYTTGATLHFAAEALREAGPVQIHGLTLIHG
ncbi:ComF family protein [Sporolactobacillus sp. THM19-2]|nr:ComF family protein [Sporolactobacillus sp. THM19-2]